MAGQGVNYEHCCFWGWALYRLAQVKGVAEADIARSLKLKPRLLDGHINACLPVAPTVLQAACAVFEIPIDHVYQRARELHLSGKLPNLQTAKQACEAAAIQEAARERARMLRIKGRPSEAAELLKKAMAGPAPTSGEVLPSDLVAISDLAATVERCP